MMLRWIILLNLCMLVVGCSGIRSKSPSETSKVDRSLAQPVPASAPQIEPGEPQPGFDQEVLAAQNPS